MRKEIRGRLQNGEPWVLEDKGVYLSFCCDCELTHMVLVDIDPKKKEATLKFYRDDHATDKFRKKEKVVIYGRRK